MSEPMDTKKLLSTIDAKVWAEEFMRVMVENNVDTIDTELMECWFASAIMTGWDKGNDAGKKSVTHKLSFEAP